MPLYFGGAPDCDAHVQKAKPYHTDSMCAILVQLIKLKFLSKIWTQGSENKYRYSGTNQGMSPIIFLPFYEFSSFVNW